MVWNWIGCVFEGMNCSLPSNHLVGALPASLGNLFDLTNVNLSNNVISGLLDPLVFVLTTSFPSLILNEFAQWDSSIICMEQFYRSLLSYAMLSTSMCGSSSLNWFQLLVMSFTILVQSISFRLFCDTRFR